MRSTPLVAAISLVLSASLHSPNLHAAPAASAAADATLLDAVIVVATRSEGLLAEAPGTVSVIPRREIERTQAQDLRDLFRYEPSVSVSSSAGRFGLGDVRIRGLGGNRVQLQVDGVDVADAFSIGSFASADRDAVDPAVLKQVEVLRGPASALYGSDALGGTVRFVTLDPDDLLGAGANAAGRIRVGVASGDDSANLGLTAAFRTGAVGWLLHATGRHGHETATAGTVRSSDATRTAANPSDQERQPCAWARCRQHAALAAAPSGQPHTAGHRGGPRKRAGPGHRAAPTSPSSATAAASTWARARQAR